jgi:hypothetical protein
MITPAMIATATFYLHTVYALCLVIVIVGVAFALRRQIGRWHQSIEDRKATKRRRATSVAPATTKQ